MATIVKAAGEKVPFDRNKIYQSLKRVGADDFLIEDVVYQISQLFEKYRFM